MWQTRFIATHCNTLQHTATPYNPLQHTATYCNTLQHTATHYNTLQHSATPCNTLQHTATHCNTLHHTASYCNTLEHTTTHHNTPQHIATRCNTLQRTATTRMLVEVVAVMEDEDEEAAMSQIHAANRAALIESPLGIPYVDPNWVVENGYTYINTTRHATNTHAPLRTLP